MTLFPPESAAEVGRTRTGMCSRGAMMHYCWTMSSISMICFDWGGVILRICRSWAEGCAAAGLDVRGESGTPAWAARRKAVSRAYETGRLTDSAFLAEMSRAMDSLYTPREIERVHHAWLVGEYPGIDAVVQSILATPGLETAMLSNTNAMHWARQALDPNGVLNHFPTAGRLRHRHASHLMGHAKPDAEIYEAFASAVGRRPSEILFFDDLADNIATARLCGWNAHQIDHTGDTASQIREHLVSRGLWRG